MKRSLAMLMILTMLLAACAPAATVVAPTSAPAEAAEPTAIPPTDAPEPTAVPPTDAPAPTEVPPTATSAPTATEAAPTEEAPTATSEPAATATAVPPTATTAPKPASAPGDPAQGKTIWAAQACIGCHGPNAEGGIGPKLAGTGLSYDQVLLQVRVGKAPMPAFTTEQISDQQVAHILAWLKSLAAAPAPAPAARQPTYPTGALAGDVAVHQRYEGEVGLREGLAGTTGAGRRGPAGDPEATCGRSRGAGAGRGRAGQPGDQRDPG